MAGSTAGLQGASASGMRQEMRRNCTDGPVSGVRTGIRLKDVRAGQDLFRPIPAQGGYGPDCLVNRGLGVRVPPSALNTKDGHQAPDLGKRGGGRAFSGIGTGVTTLLGCVFGALRQGCGRNCRAGGPQRAGDLLRCRLAESPVDVGVEVCGDGELRVAQPL